MSDWWEDDEELTAVVLEALREQRDTPASIVEAGKALHTWRSVDSELAALTYDSLDAPVASGTRAERATIREVTFVARTLTIHVQVVGGGLHGQLVPPQPGHVEVQVRTREPLESEIDDHGWFSVARPVDPAFRLQFRLARTTVHTDWVQI